MLLELPGRADVLGEGGKQVRDSVRITKSSLGRTDLSATWYILEVCDLCSESRKQLNPQFSENILYIRGDTAHRCQQLLCGGTDSKHVAA